MVYCIRKYRCDSNDVMSKEFTEKHLLTGMHVHVRACVRTSGLCCLQALKYVEEECVEQYTEQD